MTLVQACLVTLPARLFSRPVLIKAIALRTTTVLCVRDAAGVSIPLVLVSQRLIPVGVAA